MINMDINLADMLVSMAGSNLKNVGDMDVDVREDGVAYCPICHEPLQQRLDIDIDGLRNRLVRVTCKCERDAYERQKEQERRLNDQMAIDRLRRMSLMDKQFERITFASFAETPDNSKLLKIGKKYSEHFDRMKEKNQWLLLWGNPGTGKSFTAACIANELIQKQIPVIMTSFVKLLAELQNFRDGESEQSIIERINRADLLIVDDLGTERSTDYALEKVYNIVDSRYRSRKPMVLTTNLSLREMQTTCDIRYARIYDRIFEMCYPVECIGKSWRYQEAARRFDEMKTLLEG